MNGDSEAARRWARQHAWMWHTSNLFDDEPCATKEAAFNLAKKLEQKCWDALTDAEREQLKKERDQCLQ